MQKIIMRALFIPLITATVLLFSHASQADEKSSAKAQIQETTVYKVRPLPADVIPQGHMKNAKEYGYRIPSLLVTKKNTILAFIERRLGLHDHAQNDIIVKRSTDGGKSWSKEITVFEDGMNSINDPLTVQLENGRILMIFGRFPYGRHARDSGWIKMADFGYDDPKANILTYITHSDDDGLTWSKPVDISRQVKPPHVLNANSPGTMIQLQNGPHKGRVVGSLWMTVPTKDAKNPKGGKKGKKKKNNRNASRTWQIQAIYSDDLGKTWKRTPPLKDVSGKGYPNECQIVEASNGDLVIISRNQGGDTFRKKAISHDSGVTWSNVDIDKALPSVACMGGLVRGPKKPDGSWDLYASFPSNKGRKDGQIAISTDHGKTWQIKKIVKREYFGYSDLAISGDGKTLLCLYETNKCRSVNLLAIPLSELK